MFTLWADWPIRDLRNICVYRISGFVYPPGLERNSGLSEGDVTYGPAQLHYSRPSAIGAHRNGESLQFPAKGLRGRGRKGGVNSRPPPGESAILSIGKSSSPPSCNPLQNTEVSSSSHHHHNDNFKINFFIPATTRSNGLISPSIPIFSTPHPPRSP
jgi:hypothetical protein